MFGGRRRDRELEEELQFHLAQAEQQYGSRQRAVALLGGEEAIKAACREQWRGAWLGALGRDLQLGARILGKSPGFTAAAVLTLALCIGVTATVFSVMAAVFWPPIPFSHPDRLVAIVYTAAGKPWTGVPQWAGDVADSRAGAPAFSELAAYQPRGFDVAGPVSAAHVGALAVSPNFFSMLGVNAVRGRTFLESESRPGRDHEIILSRELWQRQFGRSPLLGKRLRLDGVPYTVVGIIPWGRARQFSGKLAAQVFLPLDIAPSGLGHKGSAAAAVFALGRLRPGATVAEAAAQVASIAARNAARYAGERGRGETAMTLRRELTLDGNSPFVLGMFMALAVLILLVGCANVAGLTLSRAARRTEEMATRRALGAGRMRLVRQILTENLLLAALAGGLGALVGWGGIKALNASFGRYNLRLDGYALAVIVIAAGLSAIAAGLPPALQLMARPRARGMSAGRNRGREALVAIEVGITMACLIVTAALVQNIRQEYRIPLGFDPAQVLTADISLVGSRYATVAQQRVFAVRLESAAAALPGVTAAGLVSPPTLFSMNQKAVAVRGRAPLNWNQLPMPRVYYTSSGYLDALRIPLLAGRAFTSADVAGAPPVALISRSVARRLFPGGASPLCQYIRLGGKRGRWRKIVGVTSNVAAYEADDSTNGDIFVPLQQAPPSRMALGVVVRSGRKVALDALIVPLRSALAAMDPSLALYGAQPLTAALAQSDSDAVFAHVLELMAALTLLLSAIGLYGVVACAAVERRREIGIRMAVGATAPALERLLLRGGLRLSLTGMAGGGLLGWFGLRLLLGAVGPLGVAMAPLFGVPALLISMVTLLATYLPARRAARADPLAVLRVE